MTAAARASRVPPGHYRFGHVARMEWIKLRTLRSTRWSLLAALAGLIGIGIASGVNTRNPRGDVTNNILAGGALASLVFAVLGVLVMTSEYSSGTIRATLAASPRRPLVLTAKASVFGVAALITGELATFAGFLTGAAFVRTGVPHPALSQPAVLRAVALSGAYLSLVGLIGLALGAIVRHGAAAITTVVALVFVAPLLGLAATPAGKFIPELIYANSLGATQPVSGFSLSPWAGLGIICAYAAVLLAVGGWLFARRDA
ncbi:MAG TPA: ABC transporter permease subunit [Streptosporangiaceae bacterium]|nr:ABC transporter permease subunit [Streptosporangiaceae bacterium]